MDTKPSTHYHSDLVREFNQHTRRAQALGHGHVDLSVDALLAEARHETGLEDFGDERFILAMRVLLDAAEHEAQLNPFGRFMAKSHTLRVLKNRLWAHACFQAHPEIRARALAAPVILVGTHGCGTGRVQHMLAADTRLQYLRAWEGLQPAPRLELPQLGRQVRFDEAKKALDGRAYIYPDAYDAHPMAADWPDQEMELLNQSFCGFSPLGLYNVPSYHRWFIDADKTPAYAHMADMMRLISWSRGEPESRRWTLNIPQHLLDLPALLAVFPDAQLVFVHRDPLKMVGSVMALTWCYAVQHTDIACRAPIRDAWLDCCEQMARRCLQARASVSALQQVDVDYGDMERDPCGAARRIYDAIGMALPPSARQESAAWLRPVGQDRPTNAHRFALEDFGLTGRELDQRMMFMRRHYTAAHGNN